MASDVLHHYACEIQAGPGDVLVTVLVTYYDEHGNSIGRWTDNAMAFGYTWRDVAEVVSIGARHIGCSNAPRQEDTVSPHVDLT